MPRRTIRHSLNSNKCGRPRNFLISMKADRRQTRVYSCSPFFCIVLGAEFELDSIKKLSKEYAEAKELALAEASQIVEVEDAKHLLQSDKLLGDKINEVVKEWNAQKVGFYERTGLSPRNQPMVIDNDESGVRSHENGSHDNQLMVVDNDESGVQNHEDDDDFDELEQLLE